MQLFDSRIRKFIIAFFAFCGFVISSYLAACEIEMIRNAWDPIFSSGTMLVLHSKFSQSLPVPDAGVGAFVYFVEFLLALSTSLKNIVIFSYSLIALAMGGVAVLLLSLQLFVIHEFCFLCLVSAALSILILIGSLPEILVAARRIKHHDFSLSLYGWTN